MKSTLELILRLSVNLPVVLIIGRFDLSHLFCPLHYLSTKFILLFLSLYVLRHPRLTVILSALSFTLCFCLSLSYCFFPSLSLSLSLFLIFCLTSLHSASHSMDNIIVACLRRVQEWSFVSILGELRMHSGCRQFDVEQFIESFNPDIVDISQNTPDYLLIHMRLKVSYHSSDLSF